MTSLVMFHYATQRLEAVDTNSQNSDEQTDLSLNSSFVMKILTTLETEKKLFGLNKLIKYFLQSLMRTVL
jgi:hypothetical protein